MALAPVLAALSAERTHLAVDLDAVRFRFSDPDA
jgi:hypothetical protein